MDSKLRALARLRAAYAAVARALVLGAPLAVSLALALLVGCGEDIVTTPPPGTRPSDVLELPAKRGIARDRDTVAAVLSDSVHPQLDCTDCHVPDRAGAGAPTGEPGEKVAAAECAHCHEEAAAAFSESVHGVAARRGNTGAPTCADCHGDHDILPASDPRSLVFRRLLPATCGQCHQNPAVARKLGISDPEAGGRYFESIHGRALVSEGLLPAPSCVDCHGENHNILSKEDPRSTVHRSNVMNTCGECHDGIEEQYASSVHAQALRRGDPNAPVCTTCHTAHEIVQPTGGFKLESDQICGDCHRDRLEQYLYTYHGRAHHLGSERVAACYDCHGSHDIRDVSDPASLMSVQNRVATCSKCHPGAPANFVSFAAHGDHYDRENYPLLFWAFVIMTSLIVGTFAVWGAHTFVWMGRTLLVYARDPKRFREEKRRARTEQPDKVYVRFQPIDRFTHLLVIISFVILVATGMPLKFQQTAWARFAFDLMGGPAMAAGLHRFGAILSFLYLIIHVSTMVSRIRKQPAAYRDAEGRFSVRGLLGVVFGPDSPLPNPADLKDVQAHVRWFLGRGPRPKFDRFTYWEKFDYFAELWGSAFIGLSGLVMWFPGVVATVFPGWIVNLAHIVHSQEALLAAGFILTFHFFNSHLRLEKFPMDTVIFSGRITEEELKHERGRQYERLVQTGTLDELKIQDEWASWRWFFQTFGTLALVIGGALAIGIFYAIVRYGLR